MKYLIYTFVTILSLTSCKHKQAEEVSAIEATAREQSAIDDGLPILKNLFVQANINFPPKSAYIRVVKPAPYRIGNEQYVNDTMDGFLEIWASNDANSEHKLIQTYNLCAKSGLYGPKRMENDLQIPEGYYEISSLNPASSFYLSMLVSYPNEADKIRASKLHKSRLGGSIMVHGLATNEGYCGSVGCMAMNNESIKQVYMLGYHMKAAKRKLPIHIYPRKMSLSTLEVLNPVTPEKYLEENWSQNSIELWKTDTKQLWQELLAGYQEFEKTKIPPKITTNSDGSYTINNKNAETILADLRQNGEVLPEDPMSKLPYKPDGCFNTQESELLDRINSLRTTPIILSKTMNIVSQWHTYDLKENYKPNANCGLESWSDKLPLLWTELCHNSDTDGAVYSAQKRNARQIATTYISPNKGEFLSKGLDEIVIRSIDIDQVWQTIQAKHTYSIKDSRYNSIGISMKDGYTVIWLNTMPIPQDDSANTCQ